jgi:hypothetical protein
MVGNGFGLSLQRGSAFIAKIWLSRLIHANGFLSGFLQELGQALIEFKAFSC